jgi:hypothetical protein
VIAPFARSTIFDDKNATVNKLGATELRRLNGVKVPVYVSILFPLLSKVRIYIKKKERKKEK